MRRLFAEVYVDEDMDVLAALLLRSLGFNATATRDTGHLGASDAEQLAYTANRALVLLTHNRTDFEALHRHYLADGRIHWGIIIAARRPPHQIIGNLLRILNSLTADELQN